MPPRPMATLAAFSSAASLAAASLLPAWAWRAAASARSRSASLRRSAASVACSCRTDPCCERRLDYVSQICGCRL